MSYHRKLLIKTLDNLVKGCWKEYKNTDNTVYKRCYSYRHYVICKKALQELAPHLIEDTPLND